MQNDGGVPKKSLIKQDWEIIVLSAVAVFFLGGLVLIPGLLGKHTKELEQIERLKLNEIKNEQAQELVLREEALRSQLRQINPELLREEARARYQTEFRARQNFEDRFALSQREKNQLKMKNLALMTQVPLRERIRRIAREASPMNAKVELVTDEGVFILKIDFDMASMVAGENTPRTRHRSIDSLKQEIRTLVSRVANDVFLICKDFPVEELQVGCIRSVWTESRSKVRHEEKMLLYKVDIRKSEVSDLTSNPFLDSYGAEEYLRVLEDHFDSIELVTEAR